MHQVQGIHRPGARARRAPAGSGAHPILRLGARQSRRPDAAAQGDRSGDRAGRGGARRALKGRLVIDMVVPDYYARYPKPCAGGWGRVAINVSPSGKVLPCHAAETIPGLEFWNVRDRSLAEIWRDNPAFNAFRGTEWMREPCRSCERREIDWGGCRCQALALAGDAGATDPACSKSPASRAHRGDGRCGGGGRRRGDPLALVQGGGVVDALAERVTAISDRGYNLRSARVRRPFRRRSDAVRRRSARVQHAFSTPSACVRRPDSGPNPTVNRGISKPCARVWEKNAIRAGRKGLARAPGGGRPSAALGKVDHPGRIARFPVFRNDLLPRGRDRSAGGNSSLNQNESSPGFARVAGGV